MIVRSCNVFVQLIYRALNFCGHSKDYELWRLSMEERCRAGYHVARRTLPSQVSEAALDTFDPELDERERPRASELWVV